jgi:CRP-like cAMP-binding protein
VRWRTDLLPKSGRIECLNTSTQNPTQDPCDPADARTQNLLLAALPIDARDRLLPDLEIVPMALGEVIYESGVKQKHVFFPISGCIVSMLYVMHDGASAEIAVVGEEGMVGIALFMGGGTTPSRAVVQSAGRAYRLRASALMKEFERHGDLQLLLLRFTQALITQMSQTAVCNRHHSVDQQLARWLLLSLDRLAGSELNMTQELIANMLGVRREGVTEAARKLQALNLIRYSRGHIRVLDRSGLEARACECYGVVKREYDRLLSHPAANADAAPAESS